MCAIDSGYFESRYAYITDECGTVRKFQNRKSQEVLDSVIADLEDSGFGIELLILGSRQNGTSTKILLKFLHRTLFVPNTTTLLCSTTHEKTEYMERVLSVSYDKMPWWLVPIRMPKGAFGNQSRITPQSGRASGIAQGYTPQCVYVTGVDYLPTPVKTIEEGLLRAIHSSRNTFLVLHGMKESESGYLADLYRHSKKYWSQGKSRLCPIFIPWVMCTDLYPQASGCVVTRYQPDGSLYWKHRNTRVSAKCSFDSRHILPRLPEAIGRCQGSSNGIGNPSTVRLKLGTHWIHLINILHLTMEILWRSQKWQQTQRLTWIRCFRSQLLYRIRLQRQGRNWRGN